MKFIKASERKPSKDGGIIIKSKEGEIGVGAYVKEYEEIESIFDDGDEWLDETECDHVKEIERLKGLIQSLFFKYYDDDWQKEKWEEYAAENNL